MNVPAGIVDWPFELLPQQAALPSVFTPQLCLQPAASWTNIPAGGAVSP
jgi:hypothetical protein